MVVARPRDAVAWALYYPPILTELAGRGARARPLPPGLQAAVERVAANDYAGALDALDAVPEAARDARYHTYRAGVLLNVGRVEEAEAAIERALALDPEAGDALAQRAIIQVVQNRKAGSARRCAARGRAEPGFGRCRRSPCPTPCRPPSSSRKRGRCCAQAVERNPEDALAWARLAELEQMFGDLGASRDAAEQAVALAPDLARTQMVLGFAALTRIDIGQAKAAFERAIALDSANPLPRLGLGLAIIRSGDLDAGGREIEIAAALDPNNSLIRSYLGKAYFEEKRGPLDAEQFAIAKELDPQRSDALALRRASACRPRTGPVEALHNLQQLDRAERQPRRLPLAPAARFRPRVARHQPRTRSTTISVSSSSGVNDVDQFARPGSGQRGGAPLPLGHLCRRPPARDLTRVRTAAGAAAAGHQHQPGAAEPQRDQPQHRRTGRPGRSRASTSSTPLFERNQVQVNATGLIGNNETRGAEAIASAIYNKVSISGGALSYRTDGWRENASIDQDIQDAFAQWAVTPELNVQAEFRNRDTNQGDLEQRFDRNEFDPTLKGSLDQVTGRFGLRYSPVPSSDFLFSFIYNERDEKADQTQSLIFPAIPGVIPPFHLRV